ncbi:hypothetical protein AB0M95_17275 [Sphaerisporangium sp. NPDC051017]|uniref:hypothetical protein n=1 Tax=Sphaerisporangium sp. NPDC051017 TaxID=3154636 RepID=UPI0034182077
MPPNPTRLYQAVLCDTIAPISLRLRRTFGEWLVGNGLPSPDAGKPLQEFGTGGTRVRMERRGDCGRYVVEELRDGALLRTRVTYHEPIPGLTGWVIVTVEENGATGAGHAPGFLPAYLRTARITDGAIHLTDAPDVYDEHDVPRLIHALTEHDRRVPLVVVAHDPQDPQAAMARAGRLAAVTAGAAVVVRFADLRAQNGFNHVVGPDLEVFGGGIRTYVAPFDPKTERYPYRHRPMGGGMLRSQGDQALELAAGGIIGETARRTLPEVIQRSYRMVSRILVGKAEPGDIREVLTSRPTAVNPEKEELRRKMMALTVRPAPPAGARSADTPDSVDVPVTADSSVVPEKVQRPDRLVVERSVVLEGGPAPDVAAFAQAVAGVVVDALRGELEATLELAAKDGSDGSQSGHLLRQMRTLGAHVDGLREVVLEQQRRDELGAQAAGEALLAEAEGESDRLAAEIDRLRTEHYILQDEYAEAMANARKLQKRVRWLEARLAASAQPAYGLAAAETEFEPTSLMDALNRARATLCHVAVGDTDMAATKLDLAYPTLTLCGPPRPGTPSAHWTRSPRPGPRESSPVGSCNGVRVPRPSPSPPVWWP